MTACTLATAAAAWAVLVSRFGRSAPRTKAISASALGCPARIQNAAVKDAHVLEQDAEIRLVHAQLGLDRLGRQSCLASHDPSPLSFPEARVDRLHRIGAVGIGRRQKVAKGGDHIAVVGLAQSARRIFIRVDMV